MNLPALALGNAKIPFWKMAGIYCSTLIGISRSEATIVPRKSIREAVLSNSFPKTEPQIP